MNFQSVLNKDIAKDGNSSSITEGTLTKHHVRNNNMIIYIQYKFNEIPSNDYLVMAEDGKTGGRMEGWTNNAKPISTYVANEGSQT